MGTDGIVGVRSVDHGNLPLRAGLRVQGLDLYSRCWGSSRICCVGQRSSHRPDLPELKGTGSLQTRSNLNVPRQDFPFGITISAVWVSRRVTRYKAPLRERYERVASIGWFILF